MISFYLLSVYCNLLHSFFALFCTILFQGNCFAVFRHMMSDGKETKENAVESMEAGESPPLVAGTKPVHSVIWNLMLLTG